MPFIDCMTFAISCIRRVFIALWKRVGLVYAELCMTDSGSLCLQLVAKTFPPASAISQVIKTANAYWEANPQKHIAIHCAYGAHFKSIGVAQGWKC